MHGQTDDDGLLAQMVSAFDTPAYLRRAQTVEWAWEQLRERCRRQREEWLKLPKWRLATVFALAGDVETLRGLLSDTAANALIALHHEWQPQLRIRVAAASSLSRLRQELGQLETAFERFNRRWEMFLSSLDLTRINTLRDGYNRFYVLEKECAVRSAIVARAGFQPLPPLTVEDLRNQFPLLPSRLLS